jgi:REP element-mobilizing transposase RayT
VETHCNVETRLIASLRKTEIGEIAEKFWLDIPNHFPFVILDEFVIMQNHIHGILFFNKSDDELDDECRDVINHVSTGNAINRVSTANASDKSKTGGITGVHNPMLHENLGRVIRWFKGRVSYECRKINTDFEWQSRFHDRIIRDDNELNNIRAYIFNNPENWNDDELNQ